MRIITIITFKIQNLQNLFDKYPKFGRPNTFEVRNTKRQHKQISTPNHMATKDLLNNDGPTARNS